MVWPAPRPGRLLECRGDTAPRGMTALDRTRLTGRLRTYSGNRCPCGIRQQRLGHPEIVALAKVDTDLAHAAQRGLVFDAFGNGLQTKHTRQPEYLIQIGRESCRERVCQYV